MTERLQSLQLSISAAYRNNRHDSRAAFDCILYCAHSPSDRLFDAYARCAEEHEHAQIDAVVREKLCCRIESREIESLVQLRRRDRMNRFESHRDLEACWRDFLRQFESRFADSICV